MTLDAIAQLRAANPVAEAPEVEPVERLRRLIEQEPAWGPPAVAPRRREPRSMRALVGALASAGALAAGLVLADASSGPGVNVLAAAYAATSGSGVIAAVFTEKLFVHGRAIATFHRREWIDASTERRRERTVSHDFIAETANSPGWIESWSNTGSASRTVRRFPYPPALAGASSPAQLAPSPGPAADRGQKTTAAGIALYRKLYLERALRLVGRERVDGRVLWKLEGDVAIAVPGGSHPRRIVISSYVVLVDPTTFLPVVQRYVNLLQPGHPVQTESRLVSYRRLPSDASSQALLEVAAQHPGLPVITTPAHRTTLHESKRQSS